jgi:acyl-CoA dehydrogenase
MRAFVQEVVVPHESVLEDSAHGIPDGLRRELHESARRAGVFGPTVPTEYGGLGLNFREQSIALEEAGRSLIGPTAVHCAAPDEGNVLLLEKVATADQRDWFLGPLARATARSAFAMTEPSPGAGSDPNLLSTRADWRNGRWAISGTKWFTTGANGADFFIVMAKTGESATMFLVNGDNPGLRVERTLDTLDRAFSGGHCVVALDDCQVGPESVLGEVHRGFEYAQVRLGPARLTHCMRWLGAARRTHEEAMAYANDRPMFGQGLAELGMAQQMIADNDLDIASARMMIWRAAWALDEGYPARHETSSAKVFVAEAVNRIVDRSLQLCGGTGTTSDKSIARIFREVRPFRIYDGPSEVHRWSIAKRVSRRSRAGRLPGDWQMD